MRIWIALAVLAVLLLLSLVARYIRRKSLSVTGNGVDGMERKDDTAVATDTKDASARPAPDKDGECCGLHAVCEKKERMKLRHGSELYFNDEELDAYKGVAPDGYSDEQVEEFREVLYTMQAGEVPEWTRCLQQRGIELPEALRSEVIMFLGND